MSNGIRKTTYIGPLPLRWLVVVVRNKHVNLTLVIRRDVYVKFNITSFLLWFKKIYFILIFR